MTGIAVAGDADADADRNRTRLGVDRGVGGGCAQAFRDAVDDLAVGGECEQELLPAVAADEVVGSDGQAEAVCDLPDDVSSDTATSPKACRRLRILRLISEIRRLRASHR